MKAKLISLSANEAELSEVLSHIGNIYRKGDGTRRLQELKQRFRAHDFDGIKNLQVVINFLFSAATIRRRVIRNNLYGIGSRCSNG